MSETVLIVGSFHPSVANQLGATHRIVKAADPGAFNAMSDDELADITVYVSMGWAPADAIDRMPKLKFISSFGVGYDGVAAEHAAAKGIMVGHTPDVLNDEVANTVIALILATDRRIVAYDKYVRAGRWVSEGNAPLTRSIAGKLVGIVGLGRIGERVAEKLAVFNCDVAYHSRNKKPDAPYTYYGDLLELAQAADILVVITPGGPATNKLVSKQIIHALGPDGTLVNVSRGSVVDETALVEALQSGKLGGAGLDVFEDEPNVPEALFAMDHVVLAPHVGSATIETRQAMADRVVENVEAFFADGKPVNLVPECNGLVG